MQDEDLAPFAVADGLLAKMAQQPRGRMTDLERDYLLDQARRSLAKIGDLTLGEATELMADFTEENQLTHPMLRPVRRRHRLRSHPGRVRPLRAARRVHPGSN